jgi:2-oxoisovalerate dehydrogenase E1 component alpha subunit
MKRRKPSLSRAKRNQMGTRTKPTPKHARAAAPAAAKAVKKDAKGDSRMPSRSGEAATNNRKLSNEKLREIHSLMVEARVLEERLIRMNKAGEGYFWIGGPGEEAFGVPLGLLMRVGQGLQYDFLHSHYRGSPTILAMGGKSIDAIRQMRAVDTDPYSGGRNFVNHYAIKKWNVVPVFSVIEAQYLQSIGTAHAQREKGCKGITIVTGGDAGTAEGDFASALVWSSRPAGISPLLMIVTNNKYGISTPWEGQHGEKNVADRGKAFNIRTNVINGNDVWEAWEGLAEAIEYVRTERKPFLLEARVSRLYGHSSASGAPRWNEEDCIEVFEEKLIKQKIMTKDECKAVHEKMTAKITEAYKQVQQEPFPNPESIYDHVWAEANGDKGRDSFAAEIGIDFAQNPPPPAHH